MGRRGEDPALRLSGDEEENGAFAISQIGSFNLSASSSSTNKTAFGVDGEGHCLRALPQWHGVVNKKAATSRLLMPLLNHLGNREKMTPEGWTRQSRSKLVLVVECSLRSASIMPDSD